MKSHQHRCANAGCTSTWDCTAPTEENYDGHPAWICLADPEGEAQCLDCNTSHCTGCGVILNLRRAHVPDCPQQSLHAV